MPLHKRLILPALSGIRIAVLSLLCLILLPSIPFADIYKYADEAGVVYFTDKIEKVPQQYRNKMEVRKETPVPPEPPPAIETAPVQRQAPVKAAPQEQAEKEPLFKNRFVKYAVFIIGYFVAMSAVIAFLSRFVRNRSAARLAFVLFIGFLMIYVYRIYAIEMKRKYDDVKVQMMGVQKGLEDKQIKSFKEIEEMDRN